jgi:ankyrin repeat protein
MNRSIQLVRFLIDSGAPLNASMVRGVRPIHIAAQEGDASLFWFLFRSGAQFNPEDEDGWTAAHHAALSKNPEIMDFLAREGVPLNAISNGDKRSIRGRRVPSQTPLHIASYAGNTAMVRRLLSLGVDPSVLTSEGDSPFASSVQKTKTVKAFESYPVFQDQSQRYQATHLAICSDNVSGLDLLHPSRETLFQPVDAQRSTGAHLAAALGSTRVLHYLVMQGIDLHALDNLGKTVFERAVEGGSVASARYLLVQTGSVDLVEGRSSRGLPYLHLACELGTLDMVKLLLEMGAPLDAQDARGRKPLDIIVASGHEPLASLLLAFGAEPTVCRDVLVKGNRTIQKMIELYARIGLQYPGDTILHRAVRLGDQIHLSSLCKIADPNEPNSDGKSALQLASELNKPYLVQIMREASSS